MSLLRFLPRGPNQPLAEAIRQAGYRDITDFAKDAGIPWITIRRALDLKCNPFTPNGAIRSWAADMGRLLGRPARDLFPIAFLKEISATPPQQQFANTGRANIPAKALPPECLEARISANGFTSLQGFADAIGLSASVTVSLVSGRLSPCTPKGNFRKSARKIAKALNCPVEDITFQSPPFLSTPSESPRRSGRTPFYVIGEAVNKALWDALREAGYETPRDFVKANGFNAVTLSGYLRGKISHHHAWCGGYKATAKTLAAALGKTPEELFGSLPPPRDKIKAR